MQKKKGNELEKRKKAPPQNNFLTPKYYNFPTFVAHQIISKWVSSHHRSAPREVTLNSRETKALTRR